MVMKIKSFWKVALGLLLSFFVGSTVSAKSQDPKASKPAVMKEIPHKVKVHQNTGSVIEYKSGEASTIVSGSQTTSLSEKDLAGNDKPFVLTIGESSTIELRAADRPGSDISIVIPANLKIVPAGKRSLQDAKDTGTLELDENGRGYLTLPIVTDERSLIDRFSESNPQPSP